MQNQSFQLDWYHFDQESNFAVLIPGESRRTVKGTEYQDRPRVMSEHRTEDAARRSAGIISLSGKPCVLVNINTLIVMQEYQPVNTDKVSPELGALRPGEIVSVDGLTAQVIDAGTGWAFLVGVSDETWQQEHEREAEEKTA